MSAHDPGSGWPPERYRLLGQLGEGGFGEVWKAVDPAGVERALKRLKYEQIAPVELDAHRLRFKREFVILKKLDSPSIVRVLEMEDHPGTAYFSMELIPGLPMARHLSSGVWRGGGAECPEYFTSPEGMWRAWHLVGQLLSTLDYLHGLGYIHRDLKPDNLLVTSEGRMVLIDFGLARAGDDRDGGDPIGDARVTGVQQVLGTPHYLSPEAIRGQPLDGRCDLYAAGIIAHQLFAGRVPFDAGTPMEVVLMHLQYKPEPLASLNPAIPAPLAAVIARLMEKDREKRHPSASAALAAWRAAEPPRPEGLRAEALPAAAPRPGMLLVAEPAPDGHLEATLRAAHDNFARGRGGMLVLCGPAGAGKSRRADALRSQLAAAGARPFGGRGQPGCEEPGELFKGIFELLAGRLAAKPERAADWLGADGGLLAEWYPALLRVPGLPPAPPGLDPAAFTARARAAVFRVLTKMADAGRVVFQFDDLQWADPLSLEILSTLAAQAAGAGADKAALILATCRPEEGEERFRAWLAALPAGALRADLAPLSGAEMTALVRGALGLEDDPPAPLVEWVAGASAGNPGLATAALEHLLAEGALPGAPGGGWDLEGWRTRAPVPPPAREALPLARLRGFAPAVRDALQVAARIGSEFAFALWLAAAARPEAELIEALECGLRAGLLTDRGRGRVGFAAEEARIALAGATPAERGFHARIITAILELPEAEQDGELLVAHAIAARQPAVAARHGLRLVGRLIRGSQAAAALALVARLEECLSASPGHATADRIALMLARAEALNMRGEVRQLLAECDKGLEVAAALRDGRASMELLRQRAAGRLVLGQHAEAEADARAALGIATRLGAEGEIARCEFFLGKALRALGRVDAAERLRDSALARAERCGAVVVRGHILVDRAISAWQRGDLRAARAEFLAAARAGEDGAGPGVTATALGNAAEIAIYLGDLPAAEAELARALALNRALGLRETEVDNLGNLAQIALLRGDAEAAGRHLEPALREAEAIGAPPLLAATLVHHAKQRAALGSHAEARQTLARALDLLRGCGDAFGLTLALTVQARLELDRGRGPAALIAASEASEQAESQGLPASQALALSALALARAMTGEAIDDRIFDRPLALAREAGHLEIEFRVMERRAAARRIAGDDGPAAALYHELAARAREAGYLDIARRAERGREGR